VALGGHDMHGTTQTQTRSENTEHRNRTRPPRSDRGASDAETGLGHAPRCASREARPPDGLGSRVGAAGWLAAWVPPGPVRVPRPRVPAHALRNARASLRAALPSACLASACPPMSPSTSRSSYLVACSLSSPSIYMTQGHPDPRPSLQKQTPA